MLLGHSGYLFISSKVVQLSTLIINHDKFSSEQINLFSRKMYYIEHATEKSNRRPSLKLYRRNNIRNVETITTDL